MIDSATLKGYMGAKSSDTDIETNSFTILPLEMDSNLDLQQKIETGLETSNEQTDTGVKQIKTLLRDEKRRLLKELRSLSCYDKVWTIFDNIIGYLFAVSIPQLNDDGEPKRSASFAVFMASLTIIMLTRGNKMTYQASVSTTLYWL